MKDPRYIKLKQGLSQLNREQLTKILEYKHPMCFDTWNFDEINKQY